MQGCTFHKTGVKILPVATKPAGIPEEHRTFKTKLDLALEIVKHQISNGISFDFIGADGYYGNDANFADEIDKLGYLYMLDILVSSFILKEKLYCFEEAPLLSAKDIKELMAFELYKKMTEEEVFDKILNRHFSFSGFIIRISGSINSEK